MVRQGIHKLVFCKADKWVYYEATLHPLNTHQNISSTFHHIYISECEKGGLTIG